MRIWARSLKKPKERSMAVKVGVALFGEYNLPSQGGPTKEWLLTWQAGNLPCGKQVVYQCLSCAQLSL